LGTLKKAGLAVTIVASLSGCVSRVQIRNAEKSYTNQYFTASDIPTLLNAGLQVGNEYLKLSDRVATAQDGVAVFNILLAAGAGVGVVNGISADSLARIGIAGLAVNQTGRYFDPVTTRDSLTNAARRQYCIVNAGKAYAPSNADGLRVLREAFLNVRFQLREDLNRNPVYYAELFKQYTESVAAAEKDTDSGRTLDKLQPEILKCLGQS